MWAALLSGGTVIIKCAGNERVELDTHLCGRVACPALATIQLGLASLGWPYVTLAARPGPRHTYSGRFSGTPTLVGTAIAGTYRVRCAASAGWRSRATLTKPSTGTRRYARDPGPAAELICATVSVRAAAVGAKVVADRAHLEVLGFETLERSQAALLTRGAFDASARCHARRWLDRDSRVRWGASAGVDGGRGARIAIRADAHGLWTPLQGPEKGYRGCG